MAQADSFDLVLFGSTPLAGLLAGIVAQQHGRRICLVSQPRTPFAMPRRFDLSLTPVTRPETLRLLLDGGRETARVLSRIGRRLTRRIDPVFIAETTESIAALGHFKHLARGFGAASEPLIDRSLADAMILRLRNVELLVPEAFEPAMTAWLSAAGVTRLEVAAPEVIFRRDGGIRIETEGRTIAGERAILCDDEAIMAHAPKAAGRLLAERPVAAVLTEPSPVPREPFSMWLDRGVTLLQRGRAGVLATVTGDSTSVYERLGASLRPADPLRRAGETRFATLATADGAPLFGSPGGTQAMVIAGFGATGVFLAPAIARAIAGTSGEAEAAWFAAHGPARSGTRPEIADHLAFAA